MDSIHFDRLRPIGATPAVAQALAAIDLPDGVPGRVVEVNRETVAVDTGRAVARAALLPRLRRALARRGDELAVGDWVVLAPDAPGALWVHELLEPTTRIARLAPNGARHVLVTNVDTAFIVMGLDADFNPRRVERYLALVQAAGVWPVIVLTKADCVTDPQPGLAALRTRLPAELAIEAVNGLDPAAAPRLQRYLGPGQTAVLLGSSGAGKSTLTNTLIGTAVQDTGAVRAADGRGQHTTTARTLHRLPGGGCIIDTPGLRGLRPDIDVTQLSASFADIGALSAACRFRDCCHQGEPGCAVRAAVAPDRLVNFQKMLREIQRDQMTALERRQQRREWKARSKAGLARMKMKRDG